MATSKTVDYLKESSMSVPPDFSSIDRQIVEKSMTLNEVALSVANAAATGAKVMNVANLFPRSELSPMGLSSLQMSTEEWNALALSSRASKSQ